MAFSYRDLFCGGKTFCCCLPVRVGVIIMSLLGILISGILSIIIWFEVASTTDMPSDERTAFVFAGLIQSILFVASILGFVGAVVRKKSFIQIYAYVIYTHFIINLGVAAYLLVTVSRFSANAATKACQSTVQNSQAQSQCIGLLKVAKAVYFVFASALLLVEMYGAIIVTRYLGQITGEKRTARASRIMGREAGSSNAPKGVRYSGVPGSLQERGLLNSPSPYAMSPHSSNPYVPSQFAAAPTEEFNPYEEVSAAGPSYVRVPSAYAADTRGPPLEVGYGGGSWTHEAVMEEEKERVRREDGELEEIPFLSTEGQVQPVERAAAWEEEREVKSAAGPSLRTRQLDDLPRYTLSDRPVPRPASGEDVPTR